MPAASSNTRNTKMNKVKPMSLKSNRAGKTVSNKSNLREVFKEVQKLGGHTNLEGLAKVS